MRWVRLKRTKVKVYGEPAKIVMKGLTAQEEHTHFLHSLLTNDVRALKPGEFNYNLWLKQNGQPIGDFFVYRMRDYYLLDTEKPAEEVIDEFNRLKLSLKVYFEDLTDKMDHFFLFGEDAPEFLKENLGIRLESMKVLEKNGFLVARNPVRIKADGYDLMGDLSTLFGKLPKELEISESEFENVRIESCVPKIGKELREGFSPLEAGVLNYAISVNKGCYVGQEAIARVYFRGRTPRVLVKISLEGEVSEGERLLEGEKPVGLITSVSPEGNFALGYVLRNSYEEGKILSTERGKVRLLGSCE